MRALYYTSPLHCELRESSIPVAGDNESLIEVSHCGICGSDLHAWHGHDDRRVPPLILGHEAVGIVRGGSLDGKSVIINPLHSCGDCRFCVSDLPHLCPSRRMMSMHLPGAFAEYCVASNTNLFPLPESLSFELAALSEPLSVCVHALNVAKRLCRFPISDSRIVVLGGGSIGILTALLCLREGCQSLHIAETHPARRSQLSSIIPDCTPYDPTSDTLPESHSADIIFDCVGSVPTRQSSSELIVAGGVIIHIGLQESGDSLDTRYFTLQEVLFSGVYCYTPSDFSESIDLLSDGLIKSQDWIDIRPLESGQQGFQDIHDGTPYAKIILSMQN